MITIVGSVLAQSLITITMLTRRLNRLEARIGLRIETLIGKLNVMGRDVADTRERAMEPVTTEIS